MVYLPLPQSAGNKPSYLEAYNKILSAHRRSPLSSASSVIVLVAPNVDALSAARMLATLFKQDDVAYRIIPIVGRDGVQAVRDELQSNPDVSINRFHVSCLLAHQGLASHFDSNWHGQPVRPYFTSRLLWRVRFQGHDSCYRLPATPKFGKFIRRRGEWRTSVRLGRRRG